MHVTHSSDEATRSTPNTPSAANAASSTEERAGEFVSHASETTRAVANAILEFVGRIPETHEHASADPALKARAIARTAATKAALASGTLALPIGPLGWLTILPEMIGVWRIQSQMVADIAGVYGKQAALSQEQMLYCLFRFAASQAVRDLVVRVGERVLVREGSLHALQKAARAIGMELTQRALTKSVSRWFPIAGAVGVGAYAYYDTTRVAETAIELFVAEAGGA